MALTAQSFKVPYTTVIFEPAVAGTKLGPDAAGTVYAVLIDNSQNSAASYLKLYDADVGGVTVGTTDPDIVIRVEAGAVRFIPLGMGAGLAFATSPSMACTTAGGTAGTTGPTKDVAVTLFTGNLA